MSAHGENFMLYTIAPFQLWLLLCVKMSLIDAPSVHTGHNDG